VLGVVVVVPDAADAGQEGLVGPHPGKRAHVVGLEVLLELEVELFYDVPLHGSEGLDSTQRAHRDVRVPVDECGCDEPVAEICQRDVGALRDLRAACLE